MSDAASNLLALSKPMRTTYWGRANGVGYPRLCGLSRRLYRPGLRRWTCKFHWVKRGLGLTKSLREHDGIRELLDGVGKGTVNLQRE